MGSGADPATTDRGVTEEPAKTAPPAAAEWSAPETASPHFCTQSQLRRFIKSRAYIPMHELRRRFALNGADDEMTSVHYEGRLVFIGLPEREGRMVADLVRQREVGLEISRDPDVAVAIGVFPMRPILRT